MESSASFSTPTGSDEVDDFADKIPPDADDIGSGLGEKNTPVELESVLGMSEMEFTGEFDGRLELDGRLGNSPVLALRRIEYGVSCPKTGDTIVDFFVGVGE